MTILLTSYARGRTCMQLSFFLFPVRSNVITACGMTTKLHFNDINQRRVITHFFESWRSFLFSLFAPTHGPCVILMDLLTFWPTMKLMFGERGRKQTFCKSGKMTRPDFGTPTTLLKRMFVWKATGVSYYAYVN